MSIHYEAWNRVEVTCPAVTCVGDDLGDPTWWTHVRLKLDDASHTLGVFLDDFAFRDCGDVAKGITSLELDALPHLRPSELRCGRGRIDWDCVCEVVLHDVLAANIVISTTQAKSFIKVNCG